MLSVGVSPLFRNTGLNRQLYSPVFVSASHVELNPVAKEKAASICDKRFFGEFGLAAGRKPQRRSESSYNECGKCSNSAVVVVNESLSAMGVNLDYGTTLSGLFSDLLGLVVYAGFKRW
jgi:hypothetical protein